jgi:hypothetical protein
MRRDTSASSTIRSWAVEVIPLRRAGSGLRTLNRATFIRGGAGDFDCQALIVVGRPVVSPASTLESALP